MRVLGLDVSTRTGVAVVDSSKKVIHEELLHHKALSGWPRVDAIADGVISTINEYEPTLVVIEGYGYANAHTLVPLVEIGTLIRYFLWQNSVLFVEIPPTSLKLFVCGKGNAKKENMLLEVYKHWGITAKNNDTADAIGLAMFGLCMLGVTFGAEMTKVARKKFVDMPDVAVKDKIADLMLPAACN